MIAALYVSPRGPYMNRSDVDPWTKERDARNYAGPWPVVAHPPCERWGRYWSGGPSARERQMLGDDGGCFWAALMAVRKWGGVLEHPEASAAFRTFRLPVPPKTGGWITNPYQYQWLSDDEPWEWACCVEQGHYDHPARKATWLYYVGPRPPELIWGPSQGVRLDEGFHSKAERDAARAAGRAPVKRLSTVQNIVTPTPFAELLLGLARQSNRPPLGEQMELIA